MMKTRRLVVACAGATAVAAAAFSAPRLLDAQVIRCYDVTCVKDQYGKIRCVETPVDCPPQ